MSINILLADDSITIQKVIGIIFGGEEYSLTIVDNGMAVIDKARQTDPDILLIDALMPGMSGYEVCELVRATPELAQKPILLLTGSFEPFDEDKAKSCGADDFIAKPFESQQIIAKVKELCEVATARSTTQIKAPEAAGLEPFVAPAIQSAAATTPADTSAMDDIWGAFTAAPDSTPKPTSSPVEPEILEPDVFAMVNEEPEALFTHSTPPATQNAPESIPSQWTSVEENFFEFTEDEPSEIPAKVFSPSPSSANEVDFGDISLESQPETENAPLLQPVDEPGTFFPEVSDIFTKEEDSLPSFEEPAPAPVSPGPPVFESAAIEQMSSTPPAASLSEEQIKAAIAGLSKEVIERIVWEVVPDLAENLILEAIRKIREGR